MCGISFCVSNDKGLINRAMVNDMNQYMVHRGPDNQNFYIWGKDKWSAGMGACRLRVSTKCNEADQPFYSPDKRYYLSFNGEIYNYYDLKNELLGRGIVFNTLSDTEVLLYWLITYGEQGIKALKGMYAFVFVDIEQKTTILARDPYGIKPLYYFKSEKVIAVSSEIQALLNVQFVDKELNKEQIPHFLQYNYAASPSTFYQNIYSLQSGEIIKISPSLSLVKSRVETSLDDVVESNDGLPGLERLLTESLIEKVYADANIGLMLSGGIDSSLMLALLYKSGYCLPSFTVTFNGAPSKSARLASELYKSELVEIPFTIDDFQVFFPSYLESIDQPIADNGAMANWWLFKNIGSDIRVLLSGAGADELFGGYNRHWAYYKYLNQYKAIRRMLMFRGVLLRLLQFVPVGIGPKRLYQKLLEDLSPNPVQTFDNFISSRFGRYTSDGAKKWVQDIGTEIDNLLLHALKNDQQNYLVQDVLNMTDSMSMRYSKEVRLPFLDDRVLGWLQNVPASDRLNKGRKWQLVELLKWNGGEILTSQKKEGFGFPFSGWVRKGYINKELGILKDPHSSIYKFLDKVCIDYIVANHKKGRVDYGRELWSILVLAYWLEREFS